MAALIPMSLDLGPVREEALTPQEFLRLTPSDRSNIERTRIAPPRLGESGFGHVVVHYKLPIYRAARGRRR